MKDIITLTELNKCAKQALFCCLDYVAQNTIYSPWTKKKAGWQEQWLQSKFTGLYATCNALSLLAFYKERYKETIDNAVEELRYLFNTAIDYNDHKDDTEDEKQRKARCRILLEQNCHTTLKMVYFLRTIELLKSNGVLEVEDSNLLEIIDLLYKKIESLFFAETGFFAPAIGNDSDNSVLTTMQAFVLIKNKWGIRSDKTIKAKQLLLGFISDYLNFMQKKGDSNWSKFDAYTIKSNFVSALYALSQSSDCLSSNDNKLIISAFFVSMNDREIREGFFIKDSYTVPDTVMARDTYAADSRLLYLKAVIQLIISKCIPEITIEFFIDDFIEIIDTSILKRQYLSWDSAPSFSHNIRGISILHDLIHLLDNTNMDFTVYKASPHLQNSDHRTIEPLNTVLFMSFSKEYTESVQETIHEVLDYIGFNVWWATNDPYDAFVVDSILDRLSKAQFVIIDCSERSANVMYEAGLAHGLGKPTLLCGCSNGVFPYEDCHLTNTCIFNSDGNENPPPYRDLQKEILLYVIENINDFCLTNIQKETIITKANTFISEFCE